MSLKSKEETKLVDDFLERLEHVSPGHKFYCRKMWQGPMASTTGFPDILVIAEGTTIFLEAKLDNNWPTIKQGLELMRLHSAGARSGILSRHKNRYVILLIHNDGGLAGECLHAAWLSSDFTYQDFRDAIPENK